MCADRVLNDAAEDPFLVPHHMSLARCDKMPVRDWLIFLLDQVILAERVLTSKCC